MNTTELTHHPDQRRETTGQVDLKLEAVVIPVTDVDRAKAFYASLGWRLDADFAFDNGFRVVQFTPPGSPASIQFGTNITTAAARLGPGPLPGRLRRPGRPRRARRPRRRGQRRLPPRRRRAPSSSPTAAPVESTDRPTTAPATAPSPPSATPTATASCSRKSPPGCPAASTPPRPAFASVNDLMQALHPRGAAHGEHEKRNGGEYDEQWPAWYAAYMVAEQTGNRAAAADHQRLGNPTHHNNNKHERRNTMSTIHHEADHHRDARAVHRRAHRLRPRPLAAVPQQRRRGAHGAPPEHRRRWADVTEGGGGTWERLYYDWSDPNRVVLETTDSNVWGGASGHTYTFTRNPDGTTDVELVTVREGKNLKGRLLGFVLGTFGKRVLVDAFENGIKAIEARNAAPTATEPTTEGVAA